jgi:rod shape-determining protein MreB
MTLRLRNPIKMLRSNKIALDFGSGSCRIASPQGDVLYDEPSVIALDLMTGAVIAAGTEAKSYVGKAPERIRVIRPIVAGVIQDFDAARLYLRTALARVLPDDGSRVGASVVVAQGITALERRTFLDCCKSAGIGHCDLISAPLTAAAGAGLDLREANGLLLLGIGHGLAEVSLICLADVVQSESGPFGAHAFHAAVAHHLAATRQIGVGENMAEHAATQLAWAERPEAVRSMTVTGKDTTHGTPCALELDDADLEHAVDAPLAEIETLVRRVMEKSPAELVADIASTGLSLYGGGAQLAGLDAWLAKRLGLRTRVVAEPAFAAVRGAAATLRSDLDFRRLLVR